MVRSRGGPSLGRRVCARQRPYERDRVVLGAVQARLSRDVPSHERAAFMAVPDVVRRAAQRPERGNESADVGVGARPSRPGADVEDAGGGSGGGLSGPLGLVGEPQPRAGAFGQPSARAANSAFAGRDAQGEPPPATINSRPCKRRKHWEMPQQIVVSLPLTCCALEVGNTQNQ